MRVSISYRHIRHSLFDNAGDFRATHLNSTENVFFIRTRAVRFIAMTAHTL